MADMDVDGFERVAPLVIIKLPEGSIREDAWQIVEEIKRRCANILSEKNAHVELSLWDALEGRVTVSTDV